jgi:hypothetical protein
LRAALSLSLTRVVKYARRNRARLVEAFVGLLSLAPWSTKTRKVEIVKGRSPNYHHRP